MVPFTTYMRTFPSMFLTSSIKPPAGCCGPCVITADAVQLLYWPPDSGTGSASITAAPSIPYNYVSDGVTFISPSVYVAYQNLAASRQCAPFDGDALAVYNTTLAYPPDALSTKHCMNGGPAPQIWKQMNYTMFLYPPPNSLVSDCHFFAGLDLAPASHDVAASPWFSFPSDITTVDPAFEGCSIWWDGAWDPPRTLVPESAMAASSPILDPSSTPKATPGAQVTPTLAPATTTAPKVSPSKPLFAHPKEPSKASVVKQDLQRVDPAKSTDPSNPPTKSIDPHDAAQLLPSNPETGATSAAAPATGPIAPQPSNDNSWQSSDPPSDPSAAGHLAPQRSDGEPWQLSDPAQYQPIEAAETSDPAVLVAPPAAGDASDPKLEGAPPGEMFSTSYASSPGSGPGVAVGYTPISILGNLIAAAPNGGIVVASSTIPVGVQATIDGHVVSAGSTSVYVDSNTYALPAPPAPLQISVLEPNAQGSNGGAFLAGTRVVLPFTRASNGEVVIASSTSAVGDQAAIDGHLFSVGMFSIGVDGVPYTPPSHTAQIQTQTPAQTPTLVLISGNPISTGSDGDIIVASSTIATGNQATIYGHVISAGSSNIVLDGSTYVRSFSASAVSHPTASSGSDLAPAMAPMLTFAGSAYTANSASELVIAGQTLVPGAKITVSGTPVSLASGSSNVAIVGSSTQALSMVTPAVVQPGSSVDIGRLMMSGFGDGPSPTSPGTVASGSRTSNSRGNMASGSTVPTFTGSSMKGGIKVRLLSLTVVSNVIAVVWAFL